MPLLPADAHIGEVRLAVSDLDRSIAFYTGVIGLDVHGRDGSRAALGPVGGRAWLRLEAHAHAIPRPRRSSGLFHVAIRVPSRAALGRSLRRLAARQWPLSGAADHHVSEALYLDDPDGLGVEIYRDRPRDAWSREAEETLMTTEALDLDDLSREPGAEQPWGGLPPDSDVGHVHLTVASLSDAEQMYCGEVGFSVTLRRYPGALFVAAGDYHHHLGLNVWAGRGVPPPPEHAVGLRGFTIEARDLAPRTIVDASVRLTVALAPAP